MTSPDFAPGGELTTKIQFKRGDHSTRARRHHEKFAGQEDGLVDPMRDEEDAFSGARPDVEDQFLHLLAGQRVERAQRLIHQEHVGIGGERPRDADSLTHAARKLPDAPVLDALEVNEPEHLSRPIMALLLRDTSEPQSEGDIVDDIEPRHQRAMLKHDAALRTRTLDRSPAEGNRPGGRLQETCHEVQERGLPAPGRAERDDEAARFDRQRNMIERDHVSQPRAAVVSDDHVTNVEALHAPRSQRSRYSRRARAIASASRRLSRTRP